MNMENNGAFISLCICPTPQICSWGGIYCHNYKQPLHLKKNGEITVEVDDQKYVEVLSLI